MSDIASENEEEFWLELDDKSDDYELEHVSYITEDDFVDYESDNTNDTSDGKYNDIYKIVKDVFVDSEANRDSIDIIENTSIDESDKDTSGIPEGQDVNSSAQEFLRNISDEMEKDEQELNEKMSKVISMYKKRLLVAINEDMDEKLGEEDEKLMKSLTNNTSFYMIKLSKMLRTESLIWDDLKAKQKVADILKKHAKFKLSMYLECAKIVYLAYSGKTEKYTKDAMEYVLTHARQFGDTSQAIFHINKNEILAQDEEVKLDLKEAQLPQLSANKLMNKINQLIQELAATYDESKYVILNVNTTYITLLMLRRIVKNEAEFLNAFKNIQTHDNYVKLCPSPLNNTLPKCRFKVKKENLVGCAYLAIETYLNTKDEKTKRVLRATSILYMEWNGLQLPHLFFQAVNLYKVKAGELYDLLFDGNNEYSALVTCINFADNYYNIYEKSKTGVKNLWFPYCRVLNRAYHMYLSAKENLDACIVLAYLVDMKIGFDKSTLRISHWVKFSIQSNFEEKYVETARIMYTKLTKNI